MTNTEKEFMEKQFAKSVKACETVAKKNACVKDFCLERNIECAPGIHFFRTRKEAAHY